MTKHSYVFTEIDSSIKIPVRMVRMGNGEMLKFEGKGTIAMEKKTDMSNQWRSLCSKLGSKLLSIPQMMENGYTIHFEGITCSIYDPRGYNIACV